MTMTAQTVLNELEQVLQQRIASAQGRIRKAPHEQQQRYYQGQLEALHVVHRDIANLKFELGLDQALEAIGQEPAVQEPAAPAAPSQLPEEPQKKKPRATRRSRETQPPADAPTSPFQAVAQEAISRGIITRKVSHFYHELLPDQRVKGYAQLYQAFEDNAAFRLAVQESLRPSDAETTLQVATDQIEPQPMVQAEELPPSA